MVDARLAAARPPAQRIRGLYAITPDDLPFDQLAILLEGALKGGARIVQYRRKATDRKSQAAEAHALCTLTHQYGALFIVNDDVALAHEVAADGVHWGRDDVGATDLVLLVQEAKTRARSGVTSRDFIVGLSCYNDISRAQLAAQAGCDYIAFGAMFSSATKPNAVVAAPTLFTQTRAMPLCQTLSLVAIGGITRDNANTLIAHGADAVAVIRDLFDAPTPEACEARARAFTALFQHKDHHV